MVDPNQYKRVYVPIVAFAEADGKVFIKEGENSKGIARITIQIYNKQGKKVAETLSESDGYFSYLGLKPGDYMACVDSVQLRDLNLTVNPPCQKFTIKSTETGDIFTGLDFILSKIDDFDKIKSIPK